MKKCQINRVRRRQINMEKNIREVQVWEERITIPTYEVGTPDKNPMFFEKRVYQGSSGKVYPLPVIDKIYDEKKDKEYNAVWLENEYLKIMILPELGGRIQRAYDKTNGYDFVYYNEVIKPALVGLTGPWISGGIEFNWPQHHRPTTFSPVDYVLQENEDGSKTVFVSEVDRMYGTKGMAGFTLYPGKAYLEIRGQLYNRTELPQTFLWWANPAVAVNDNTQSIFPPDVHAVMDHGKRDVSRFPVARGVYYKHNYGEGVDISRYKNIPVPTSYMAYHSDYNFVGGYDYGKKAGILHIADHHVSPGKKQWTWGCGDFGQAWDRNLTDKNGPYIELMTGVYTDNQPDFTWLKPFEEKTFVQYFMPYKEAGNAKNATKELVLNIEKNKDNKAEVTVYASEETEGVRICVTYNGKTILDEVSSLSPVNVFKKTCGSSVYEESGLEASVYGRDGHLLLSYKAAPEEIAQIPAPAKAAEAPEEIATNEELYLTGMHIEQYRHATYRPDPYYLEGLKRDPGDIRINTSYGLLLLRRGLFNESETYFRKAVARSILKNPNPYISEAYYDLGLSLFHQERYDEAFDAFYKATWSNEQQEMSYYYLAVIASRKQNYAEALELVEKGLVKNMHNVKARGLKAVLLRVLGREEDRKEWLKANIEIDPFDYMSRAEAGWEEKQKVFGMMRYNPNAVILLASDYAEGGFWKEAVCILEESGLSHPMICYYTAYYKAQMGDGEGGEEALRTAVSAPSDYCFPNRLEDISVLEWAADQNRADAKARYYLGNLWYDKYQYEKARNLWECSAEIDPNFPTVWRNLSLVYFNKTAELQKAREAMEKAFHLNESDARILLELDQLYKKMNVPVKERFTLLDSHVELARTRDDLYTEYISLLNLQGRYEEAYRLIMEHKFHPWEGGEGKITMQYRISLIEMAKEKMEQSDMEAAEECLKRATVYPVNLGEGKLEGVSDNDIYYYLGMISSKRGDGNTAREMWENGTKGLGEIAGMMYYNDQPADMIFYQGKCYEALGDEKTAATLYNRLLEYGESHIFDEVHIDYFAVSLPDLQLFDEDLTRKNKIHCHYLLALGHMGLGHVKQAEREFDTVRGMNESHEKAFIYRKMCV